jgi:ABC-2 type transport system permease protein
MNIFLQEIKEYRKSTIIWIGSISGIIILFMSMFPAFSKDVASLTRIFAGYPEAVKKILNLTAESFASLLGFYSFILLYVILCGAIQAMNLGTSILSKEVSDKTADFQIGRASCRERVY